MFYEAKGHNLIIAYDDKQLDNSNFESESFTLTESLCSESELTFGKCEASSVEILVHTDVEDLTGKEITISMEIGEETFQIGKYVVKSFKYANNKKNKKLIAYDALETLSNANVASWYNAISFPVTLLSFRNALFSELGISQVAATLVNDSLQIEKTISAEVLSGRDVIQAICELNGCFGHINREGKFEYITLKEPKNELYPKRTLFPSDTLLPIEDNTQKISSSHYIDCSVEDYKSEKVTQLQIRSNTDDIGVVVGDEGNDYIIQDNFLIYGKSTDSLTAIANNVLPVLAKAEYCPFEMEAQGNLELSVGDLISFVTDQGTKSSYILTRTCSGIQNLIDEYEAHGEEYHSEDVNGLNNEIIQLKSKTNILSRTVEGTVSKVADLEEETETYFTQTDRELSLKATKANLISEINASPESITIKSSKIKLDGDTTVGTGFTLSADKISTGTISGVKGISISDNLYVINTYGMQVKQGNDLFDNWTAGNGNYTLFTHPYISDGTTYYKVATLENMILAAQSYSSDKRIKQDINYDVRDYSEFFDNLKPCAFKFNDDLHDNSKVHLGFIAQDIVDYASVNNLSLVDTTDAENYKLDKTELIALCVNEIQKLKKEIKELRGKIDAESI